jgi:ABC-type bacteriocin/lantibiotic exporter with double-glycine peptidase domain
MAEGANRVTVWDLFPSIERILRGERREIWIVITYGLGIGLFTLVVPIAVQALVNTVAFGTVLQPLVALTAFVFVGIGIASIMELLQLRVVEFLQRRIYVRVSVDLARRIPLVTTEVYRSRFTPQLVNRYLEVFTVQKSVFQILLVGVSVVLQTLIGMVLLMFYHPYLLVFSLIVIAGVMFIYLVLSRGAVNTAIRESDAKYQVVSWLTDIASKPVLFKSAAGTEYAIRKSDEVTSHWLDCREAHFRILMREKAMAFLIQTVASAGMLAVGGYLVIIDQLSLGQLVAAEIVVSLVLHGITKFTKQVEYFYELTAGISKLDSLSNLELENEQGDPLPTRQGPMGVAFRNFILSRDGQEILSIPKFEIKAGAKIAVLGPNGSGKSMLADALFKMREPATGTILLDEANIRDLKVSSLRKEVALIRGAEIFSGTIAENLKLGDPDLTRLDLREALDAVGLSEELDSLPEALETQLTPSGAPLSRGQSYRLVLARAILRRPRLLIIDESLDSIDDEELTRAFLSLQSPGAPWTLIVFTHEQHVLEHFEERYILQNGTIFELKS